MIRIEKSFGIIPVTKRKGKYYFLLVRHNAGHWSFPKGHPEKGETGVETARREFSEETGLGKVRISNDAVFTINYFHKRKGKVNFKTVRLFLGFLEYTDNLSVQTDEISDYKWVGFEEARDLLTYKNSKKVLNNVYKYLTSKNSR